MTIPQHVKNYSMRFLILFPLLSFLFDGNAQDYPTVGFVERLDDAINELIPEASKIEVLAEGFDWSEGPFGCLH